MPRTKQVTSRVTIYRYLCVRTCFFVGKRWFAGTNYEFNRRLDPIMESNFEFEGSRTVQEQPIEGLAYTIDGREKNRPSEYQRELA